MTRPGTPPAAFARYAWAASRERVHRADLGAEMTLVDQPGELGQLGAAGLLDEDDGRDVVPVARHRSRPP